MNPLEAVLPRENMEALAGRQVGLRYLGRTAGQGRELGLSDTPLKFLLVGDPDVGKDEFLAGLPEVEKSTLTVEPPESITPRMATVAVDGRTVSVQLWDTSGQGRFSAVMRHYARGAHGILLVYDISNRWSWGGMKRWLREIDEHALGIPRVLVGNRLHREFDRAVRREDAEAFAHKRKMDYFEVSTLAHFNVDECLTQLARLVIQRTTMQRYTRFRNPETLRNLAARAVAANTRNVHLIDRLPVPQTLHSQIRSFARGSQVASAHLPVAPRRPEGLRRVAPALLRRVVNTSAQRISRTSCRLM